LALVTTMHKGWCGRRTFCVSFGCFSALQYKDECIRVTTGIKKRFDRKRIEKRKDTISISCLFKSFSCCKPTRGDIWVPLVILNRMRSILVDLILLSAHTQSCLSAWKYKSNSHQAVQISETDKTLVFACLATRACRREVLISGIQIQMSAFPLFSTDFFHFHTKRGPHLLLYWAQFWLVEQWDHELQKALHPD